MVFENRLPAFLEKVRKTTPEITRFGYPFGTCWVTFGVPLNGVKNVTPKMSNMVPEGTLQGLRFGAPNLSWQGMGGQLCQKGAPIHLFISFGLSFGEIWVRFGSDVGVIWGAFVRSVLYCFLL